MDDTERNLSVVNLNRDVSVNAFLEMSTGLSSGGRESSSGRKFD